MIEYIDSTHTYMIDGVIVPSVTQIVAWYFGDTYANVDPEVLQRSADYGTAVHKLIENYESVGIGEDFPEVKAWIKAKERYGLHVYKQEMTVEYRGMYCGRFDILCDAYMGDINRPCLIDIKTTSKFMRDHLALQLGLYRMALGYGDIECACVWMPRDGRCELYPVTPYSNEKCESIVKTFLEGKESPYSSETQAEVQIYTANEIAKIRQFYSLKKEVERIEAEGRERALRIMKERGIKSVSGDGFRMSYIEPSVRMVADVPKMKKDGIFDDYSKEQKVKESVRITWDS